MVAGADSEVQDCLCREAFFGHGPRADRYEGGVEADVLGFEIRSSAGLFLPSAAAASCGAGAAPARGNYCLGGIGGRSVMNRNNGSEDDLYHGHTVGEYCPLNNIFSR